MGLCLPRILVKTISLQCGHGYNAGATSPGDGLDAEPEN
jgi:hypothetical protein